MTTQKVQELLVDAVSLDDLADNVASAFHDRIAELKKTDPVFYRMLWEYESFTDYFEAANETLDPNQQILLKDMELDQGEIIDDLYDKAEDRVKEDLRLRDGAEIMQDMKQAGFLPAGALPKTTRPTDDMIEEFYLDAFRAFDDHKAAVKARILTRSPMKAFKRGEEIIEQYRKDKGILFDEVDFLTLFDERFEADRLQELLMDKVREALHYNRHYELEPLDEEDADQDAQEQNDRLDAILVPKGDMRSRSYGYVSEMMSEYTGRRLYDDDENGKSRAFWSTYADDFQDMILSYVLAKFDAVIVELKENQSANWEAFCKASYLSSQEREDTEQILLKCDRINYGLGQRAEEAWNRLCDSKI